MHKLIGRLVATVGVDRAAAVTAVGIILRLRHRRGAVECTKARADRLHSARVATQRSQSCSKLDAAPAIIRAASVQPHLVAKELAVGDRAGAVPARIG
jgi:hypothetical protein